MSERNRPPARRVLIVADLEGIAGVDSVDALIYEGPGHDEACEALTRELGAVVASLLAQGWEEVLVSDSHRSGSPFGHVDVAELPDEVEVVYEGDALAPELFDEVSAFACLGMHAGAGGAGFCAHTMNLSAEWWLAGRRLNETDVVCGLAAERGLPGLFVSGGPGLRAEVGERLPFVASKRRVGTRLVSRPVEGVTEELARAAAGEPVAVPPAPAGAIELRFKSCWQAAAAVGTGVRRLGPRAVACAGGSFRDRYETALQALHRADAMRAVRGSPGEPAFAEDVKAMLGRSADDSGLRLPRAAFAAALAAFLRLTAAPDPRAAALRALSLHMLEGFAPRVFAHWGLAAALREAVDALRAIPARIEAGLAVSEVADRIDAWYVRCERGGGTALAGAGALRTLPADGPQEALERWVARAMARQLGVVVGENPEPEVPRSGELYIETHRVLLASRFLRLPAHGVPFPRLVRALWAERLLLAAPGVCARGEVDLAGELLFCLVWLGESCGRDVQALLDLLLRSQDGEGCVWDLAGDDPSHPTAAGMLAFAGVLESDFRRGGAGDPG